MRSSAGPTGPVGLNDLPRLLEGAEGFPAVIDALSHGRAATVDGAWNSSAALVAATLALRAPQAVLLVLAHPRDLDFWIEDLHCFSGLRSLVFPAWDALPTAETVLDDVGGQRLRLLRQLENAVFNDVSKPQGEVLRTLGIGSGKPQGEEYLTLGLGNSPKLIVTTFQALLQPVPDREQLGKQRRRIRTGASVDLEELTAWLVDNAYQRMEAVELPGEFSRRGGILDVFSPDAEVPYRLEFLGDEVESLRPFDPQTQRSMEDLQAIDIAAAHLQAGQAKQRGNFTDFLPPRTWTLLVEPAELEEQGKHYLERIADVTGLFSVPSVFQKLVSFPSVHISALPTSSSEITCHLRVESVERFSGNVAQVREELDRIAVNDLVMIACHNEAEKKRLAEVLQSGQLAQSDRLRLVVGQIRAGFRMVAAHERAARARGPIHEPAAPARKRAKTLAGAAGSSDPSLAGAAGSSDPSLAGAAGSVVVLGDHELFLREQARTDLPRRQLEARAIDSFLDLQENDLVVHLSHGIARYRGMQVLDRSGHTEEHLILEFAGGTRVYVPASKIDLVQKYVGGARVEPELSKLGGTSWARRKERVEEAVLDLASDMVELQALREAQPGVIFPADSDWQREFEAAFPYQETPDQLTSLAEIKRDMQRARPMDRLVCGDVGYGKTELAIRAAFKCIDHGRQVAVLVPTTVLAEQHFRTFSQRLAEYPFTVEVISRFRTAGEQKRIVKRLAEGKVDIIIGTHRLVSPDVQFKDLGLVIIDEEQRFGVEHKDRFKKLRQTVDVLTLTATPIPRTLHLSLLGIRDISNLETPPQGRLAIETRIIRFDRQLIRHAILRELNREGQVYFVHNRVHNIHAVADEIQSIVPESRIVVGHGQMHENELERAMVSFVKREADILVATTIIESGLDIPNANTIFINEADNYGLADLHQLRGRVGRYKNRAYAYMVLADKPITPTASRRLKAIEEFTELGAGFKIAMRDLEIRGAGNILGTQQSGHIAAVGYELYCQLLENAVRRMKDLPQKTPLEVTVDMPWHAYLPRDYVPGQKLKIEVYRRLSRIRRPDRLEDFCRELRDRFGPWPEPVSWLLRLAELRLLASRWQIATVHLEGKGVKETMGKDGVKIIHLEPLAGAIDVVLGYRNRHKMEKLVRRTGVRLRIVDGTSAYFRLEAAETPPLALFECMRKLLRLPERKGGSE